MTKALKSSTLILLLILVFGFFLRAYNITKNSLYGDELTLVYDSYSLLKTGHDQLGNFLPLTFTMGAGRPAGYVYGTIPFVAIFGPTEWGVRSLSLLSGLGVIVLLYLLGKRLFTERIGLVAAFIGTVSPWELSISRGGFETNFALFLALLGVVAFFYADSRPKLYIISAISWGLAINTYPTYKLVLPIYIVFLLFSSGIKDKIKKAPKSILLISSFIIILLGLVSYGQTVISNSEQRFFSLNIFSKEDLKQTFIQQVDYERSIDSLPNNISQVFHNRPEKYFKSLADSYIRNLSADFLFLTGDSNPRHNMSLTGELYLVEIVLAFFGSFYLFERRKKREALIVFTWILVAPLATTLLLEQHALRNLFMLPPLILLSSLGINFIYEAKNKLFRNAILTLVSVCWLVQFGFILERTYFVSPSEFSRFWSFPAKESVLLAQTKMDNFDYIFISTHIDNAEYAYPVYQKLDPNSVISQNKNPISFQGLSFKNYGTVYLGNIPQARLLSFLTSIKGRVLYIGDYSDVNFLKTFQVYDSLDKTHALVVSEFHN